ncbi:MAG: diacylglycerol kinase family lipid kinase [Eggerthellaceae bacterium]|nr:diacylglycerol kinase family lipid kinase [Eggerthellaceae bacterium]
MDKQRGKTLVIVNPVAKRSEAEMASYHVRHILRDALGAPNVDVVQTVSPGHATYLASGSAGEYAHVVTIGGDGAVHETINGLMQIAKNERPAFGLIPVGSGNDYARTLGMSENIEEACQQLLGAETRMHDVGKVNDEYFIETLSFGLDAAIALGTVEARHHTKQTGGALYFGVGIDQLLHHLDNYQIQVQFDDEPALEISVIMFAIQNGPTYGGGFKICPQAEPDDGLFDICYAEGKWSVPRAVAIFARTKNGNHTKARNVVFKRASRVRISFDKEPPAQAEGEKITGSTFDVTMYPRALEVFAP